MLPHLPYLIYIKKKLASLLSPLSSDGLTSRWWSQGIIQLSFNRKRNNRDNWLPYWVIRLHGFLVPSLPWGHFLHVVEPKAEVGIFNVHFLYSQNAPLEKLGLDEQDCYVYFQMPVEPQFLLSLFLPELELKDIKICVFSRIHSAQSIIVKKSFSVSYWHGGIWSLVESLAFIPMTSVPYTLELHCSNCSTVL
jgi:hypothetical protein